ncbi:metallophosphoesterase [Telmatocola sphagniphila]|uniref:Metallophosphoesterase n=1 Tax=Telmatocola sphagniphila TaxID=1123043 RepID=A0A8E6ETN5_9BACT|nr:metallophosphoesterase [Telmatocola sphagniphila]QVL32644.1 metallophosphoesterase [Telmatocola sphagniphila]
MIKIAVTADLHFGTRHTSGYQATLDLYSDLADNTPDILILAGDIGAGEEFERCLSLFQALECQKLVVPGNHDIWVRQGDERGDSFQVYDRYIPELCDRYGFHYLDHAPYLFSHEGLAIIGSMNWYDGSWGAEQLRLRVPDWQERLSSKRFSRGMHNDANFIRWDFTDQTFCEWIVRRFEGQLNRALDAGYQSLVVTHHPPLQELMYPTAEPRTLDELLWPAFSGNLQLEELSKKNLSSIPFVFCGHTHYARKCQLESLQGINVGGDYHFKRLVRLNWPTGELSEQTFGDAALNKKRPGRSHSPKSQVPLENR